MKATILFLFTFIATQFLYAQDSCSRSRYYPFTEGAKFQITTYDKKDKAAAIADYLVESIESSAQGEKATIATTVKDDKGKDLVATTFDVLCINGAISIDFKSLMPPGMLDQYKNLDYKISGTNMEIPANLEVGKTLPDANMTMDISMAPMKMQLQVNITNRQVEGKEQVTTAAGTFDCFVITYTTELNMGMSRQSSSKQWIAEGVGMVKQEDYDNKGRVASSSVLTAFSK
ncbi:hypothetical protein ACH3O9_04270 [Leeuwenhoekiella sp. A16]|uniref:TapB family protein n=1 Tax=unclassified Leeuwenhoekiella TaxID=2615029 RepID=UPI003A7FB41A